MAMSVWRSWIAPGGEARRLLLCKQVKATRKPGRFACFSLFFYDILNLPDHLSCSAGWLADACHRSWQGEARRAQLLGIPLPAVSRPHSLPGMYHKHPHHSMHASACLLFTGMHAVCALPGAYECTLRLKASGLCVCRQFLCH